MIVISLSNYDNISTDIPFSFILNGVVRRGGDLNSREAEASRALQARAVPDWATSAKKR